MAHHGTSQIDVDATAEELMAIVADIDSYPDWLPDVKLHQLGLPTPTLQFEVRAHGVLLGRSDFAWEEHRLLGEFDGRIKYDGLVRPGQSAADVIMAEKRREQRLRDANWWVVRWTYDSLNRPEELARTIRAGFQQARAFRALSDSPAWAEDGQPPAA